MRLVNNRSAARWASLALLVALSGCGGGAYDNASLAIGPAKNGPAADYPVVIGDPYSIGEVTYTPADAWNVDEVGLAVIDSAGGDTISGAHHTLPLPSYVEVTSLDTGRTILLRVERRGPMDSPAAIALSPGAAEQLGASSGTPVRVRRVNPPEVERAALRSGARVPQRMDTPMSLVSVLKLRLPGSGGPAPLGTPESQAAAKYDGNGDLVLPPAATASQAPAKPVSQVAVHPDAGKSDPVAKSVSPAAKPEARPEKKPATAAKGKFVVQAGAFSIRQNADRVAEAIGGQVSKSGSLYLVRTGPFASRKEAEGSLAKVKAAGYSDARIY